MSADPSDQRAVWSGRTRPINTYLSLALVSLRQSLTYRRATLMNIGLTFFWVIVLYNLWRAAYAGQSSFAGFTWDDMRTYVVLGFGINALVGWQISSAMMSSIRSGAIALEVVRPWDYCGAQLARASGVAVTEGVISMVLTLVVGIGLVGMHPPASVGHTVLFVVALVLGFVTKSLVIFLVALVMVWTINGVGVMYVQDAVIQVLSGAIVPLALMPDALRRVAEVLPLRGIVSTPATIYLGHTSWSEAFGLIGLQLLWVVVLAVLASLAWRKAFRHVEIQGG